MVGAEWMQGRASQDTGFSATESTAHPSLHFPVGQGTEDDSEMSTIQVLRVSLELRRSISICQHLDLSPDSQEPTLSEWHLRAPMTWQEKVQASQPGMRNKEREETSVPKKVENKTRN